MKRVTRDIDVSFIMTIIIVMNIDCLTNICYSTVPSFVSNYRLTLSEEPKHTSGLLHAKS